MDERYMSLVNKIILGICIALGISILINVIQYRIYHREPEITTTTQSDTTSVLDTIKVPIFGEYEILNPPPVVIDSFIAFHIDTFYHTYGYIVTRERVFGNLLSKGIDFKFDIPTYYQTRTITNRITNTIRNDLVFVHGGFDYSLLDYSLSPMLGATYIWNKHRRIMSINYSFMDKRIELNAGFSLWR